MSLTVGTNTVSLGVQRSLNGSGRVLGEAMERLSSGKKINQTKDDAAGSAISSRMTMQINGLNKAVKNVNDALAMFSVADSAATDITDMLQRMRELAIQAASDTNSAADRQYLQDEVDSLIQEIDRIATQTQYNGENLLDGSKSASFQVGANSGQTIGFDFRSLMAGSFEGISSPASSTSSNQTSSGPTTDQSDPVSTSSTQTSSGPITDLTDPVLTGITIDKSVVDVSNGAQTINVQLSGSDESSIKYGYANFTHVETGHQISGSFSNTDGFEVNDLPSISINVDESNQAGMYDLNIVVLVDTAGNDSWIYRGTAGSPIFGETFPIEVVGGDIQPTIANQSYSWSQEVDESTQPAGHTPTGAPSQSYSWSQEVDTSTQSSGYTPTGAPSQSYSWSQEVDTSAQSSGYAPTGAPSQSYDGSLYSLGDLNITNSSSSMDAIASITAAIDTVTAQRAEYGAMRNRLQYTISNLMGTVEATEASRSKIEDADFAIESAKLAKAQILQQAGTAMLSQANGLPQMALSLIRQLA